MKTRLTIHHLISFILAFLLIFLVNISFMVLNIYVLNNNKSILNYEPTEILKTIYKNVYISNNNTLHLSDVGIKTLNENNIGLQILDENNNQILEYNAPVNAPTKYSNKTLIDMYNANDKTLFLGEHFFNDMTYSYLLFLDSAAVRRVSFSYDYNEITKIHRFPLLITINILIFLAISFLYTLRITKPINTIVEKIFNLSKGIYKNNKVTQSVYSDVEHGLNELGNRLCESEKDREKLEKMREEWISNISHDIKTPLTSIIGNAEIISDTDYDLDTESRVKNCNTIINKSIYIKNLVEDLNLSTRLKNNTLILNKKKINIVSLLRHIIIDIINDESHQFKNIEFNYSDDEIFLNLDENLIRRVFINLISNSYIHNDSNVSINISIKKTSDKHTNIIISDDGKGISSDELSYIFERYYRGTNTKKKTEGSGLGMAIAHDIVKAHKAYIKAYAKTPNGMEISIDFI